MERTYQFSVLLHPRATDQEIRSFTDTLHTKIKEQGGTIEQSANAIKTHLAHPIKKLTEAWILHVVCKGPLQLLSFFDTLSKQESNILRTMYVALRTNKFHQMLQARTRMAQRRILEQEITQLPVSTIKDTKREPAVAQKEKPKVKIEEIEKKLEELLQ